ncbi:MAG: M20 family metallopeptidase [Candidatus Marinimicrobia bacterium]|nr:M20 family metallopeptidase [Candidatus Neomarinimicrobiota bacterium]
MSKIPPALMKEIVSARQWLHEHPELSYKEFETTKFIKDILDMWDIQFHNFQNIDTGGYVDIGNNSRTIIGFRSDIDALPITENPAHNICSKNNGVMHACGHDFHTAIGLGLLKYFNDNQQDLNGGGLRVIFQPAEEATPDGAEFVSKESLFKNMTGLLGIHVDGRMKVGQYSIIKGTACASSTRLEITFIGKGGHTSRPHNTVDLIRVTSQYIVQLPEYLKACFDSRDNFVLVFGKIEGGHSHNIIPSEIKLTGTLRNFDNHILDQLLKRITIFSDHFAKLYGLDIVASFPNITPAVINDDRLYNHFIDFSNRMQYYENIQILKKPSMGADDFSLYLDQVPGLYFQIGAGGTAPSHSSDFLLNDDLIEPALSLLVDYIQYLNKHNCIYPFY